jgi:hypothetical protein
MRNYIGVINFETYEIMAKNMDEARSKLTKIMNEKYYLHDRFVEFTSVRTNKIKKTEKGTRK